MNTQLSYQLFLQTKNKKTEEYDVEQFRKNFDEYAKTEDLACVELLNALHIDVNNTKKQKVNIDGQIIEFQTIPHELRAERESLRQQLLSELPQADIDYLESNSEILKHPFSQSNGRDFIGLFGDRMVPTRDELRGVNVAYKLTDPNVKPEEKNKLFEEYIDMLMDNAVDLFNFKSDKEFVENYSKIRAGGSPFMLDAIDKQFKEFAGCELDANIFEKYKNYRSYTQDAYYAVNSITTRICDPSYQYFDSKNLEKIGSVMHDCDAVQVFTQHSSYLGKPIKIFEEPGFYLNQATNLPIDKGAFNVAKRAGKIDKDAVFFDEKGKQIDDKEAAMLYGSKKLIGWIGKSGRMAVSSINENYIMDTTEISQNFDRKAKYKEMLAELNKGTSAFTISSKEYKNMRSILSNLSKGKGNEIELISSLEENAAKYLENHYQKSTISNTAIKRKGCVENMMKTLAEVKPEAIFGDILRANVNEKVEEKSIDTELSSKIAADLAESSFSNGGKVQEKTNEPELSIEKENELEAKIK